MLPNPDGVYGGETPAVALRGGDMGRLRRSSDGGCLWNVQPCKRNACPSFILTLPTTSLTCGAYFLPPSYVLLSMAFHPMYVHLACMCIIICNTFRNALSPLPLHAPHRFHPPDPPHPVLLHAEHITLPRRLLRLSPRSLLPSGGGAEAATFTLRLCGVLAEEEGIALAREELVKPLVGRYCDAELLYREHRSGASPSPGSGAVFGIGARGQVGVPQWEEVEEGRMMAFRPSFLRPVGVIF